MKATLLLLLVLIPLPLPASRLLAFLRALPSRPLVRLRVRVLRPRRAPGRSSALKSPWLLLTLPALLLARPLAAGGLLVTGRCPLGESTFAIGDTLTFTEAVTAELFTTPDPSFLPCEPATFTASGVTGKPPLSQVWTLDGGLQYPGASVTLNTGTLAAGSHSMLFTAANAYGTATRSVAFSVQPLAFLLAPSYENLGASTAVFRANTSGATEWRWTWGDGTSSAWLTGCSGYGPTHAYLAAGTYTVQVQARNCRDAAIQATFPATVTATLAPRVLTFAAACPFGFCVFPTSTPILFAQTFAGTPTLYRYDWDGNGTFEQTSAVPVASHAYAVAGLFTPRLEVSDGISSDSLAHTPGPILIQGSQLPLPAAPDSLVLDVVAAEYQPQTTPPPSDVLQLAALIVRLRWSDRSTDETGFNVYRSTADGPYQLVAVTAANTPTTANLRVPAGALYRFRATAFNAAGESQPSAPVTLDLRP